MALSVTNAPERAPVWCRPRVLGYHEALRGLGGIVSPLLAGFSLTAMATIATSSHPPREADAALSALALSLALLLFSMQVAFLSLTQNSSPQDVLMWRPEATVSVDELQRARAVQASDFREMGRLGRLSLQVYGWALVTFLLGVLMLLIPHHWTSGRVAAVVIAGASLFLEVWWLVANQWPAIPHPVIRNPTLNHAAGWDGPPPALDELAIAAVLRPQTDTRPDTQPMPALDARTTAILVGASTTGMSVTLTNGEQRVAKHVRYSAASRRLEVNCGNGEWRGLDEIATFTEP